MTCRDRDEDGYGEVYYVPAKRECCIPQSSPGHHEIQAGLIPSQLGGEPDEKNGLMRMSMATYI